MFSKFKKEAKDALRGNYGVFIILMILELIISGVTTALSYNSNPEEISISSYGGSIFSLFVLPMLQMSTIICTFKVLEGIKVDAENIGSGFKEYWKIFGANILIGLYTFLWTLLFIIPGIIKSYSYRMTYHVIRDNPNMTINEAITESRRLMDGHKLELWLLDLSFIGWYLLSVLTFGILLFYVQPYAQTTVTRYYMELRGPIKSNGNGSDDEFVSVSKKCPLCGTVNKGNREYCDVCGEKLD